MYQLRFVVDDAKMGAQMQLANSPPQTPNLQSYPLERFRDVDRAIRFNTCTSSSTMPHAANLQTDGDFSLLLQQYLAVATPSGGLQFQLSRRSMYMV